MRGSIAGVFFVLLTTTWSSAAGSVTLTVKEPSGVARKAWPVTSGVPLPQGTVTDVARLRLAGAGDEETVVQGRPLARWADGSVKAILLDFQTDLAPHETKSFTLEFDRSPHSSREGILLAVEDPGNRIVVSTGPARFLFRDRMWGAVGPGAVNEAYRKRFAIDPKPAGRTQWGKPLKRVHYPAPSTIFDAVWIDSDGDGRFGDDEKVYPGFAFPAIVVTDDAGTAYASHRSMPVYVELEEAGPLRAVVKVSGYMTPIHPEGHVMRGRRVGYAPWQATTAKPVRRVWLDHVARVHLYARKRFARIQLTIRRGGGDFYGMWGMDHRFMNDLVAVRDISVFLPLTPAERLEFAVGLPNGKKREGALGDGARVRLTHGSPRRFELDVAGNKFTADGTAPGWARLGNGRSAITVAVRDFAQRHPKALELAGDGLVRAVLWESRRPRMLGIGQGFTCTHDIYVGFSREGADLTALLKQPFAVCPPEWMCASGVFGDLVARIDERFPDYWKYVVGDNFSCAAGSGMLKYRSSPYEGDKHGSGLAESALLHFAMTGRLEYLLLADRIVRRDAEHYYSHMPVETGDLVATHMVRPYGFVAGQEVITKALSGKLENPLRRYTGGCYFVCRGMSIMPPMQQYVHAYVLTGNERIRDVTTEIARYVGWATRGTDGSVRGEDRHGHWRRLFGHIWLDLMQQYELTGDPKTLDDIRYLASEMLQKPYPTGWPLHYRSGARPHAGSMGFTWLARAAVMNDGLFGTDEATDELVVRFAREYVSRFWDPELKTFRYTHHRKKEPQPIYLPTLHFLATLSLAYQASGEDRFMDIGRECYRALIADAVPKAVAKLRESRKRYNGTLMRAMRTLPYFLAALDRYERENGLEPSR